MGQSVKGAYRKLLCPKKPSLDRAAFYLILAEGRGLSNKVKNSFDIFFSEFVMKHILHGYLLSQYLRTFEPNEMGEHKLHLLHSHNLHHRIFNWTLSWHFTFQPKNSPQVLNNMLYKKKVIYWKRTVNSS